MKIFLLLVALAALYTSTLNGQLTGWGDDPVYVVLAEALARGQGYAEIQYPIPVPHVAFPPLLPSLLAPLVYLLGVNFLALKIPVVVFGLLAVYLTYCLFRLRKSEGEALLIASLTGIAPLQLLHSTQILSELPYAALSLLALIVTDRYLSSGGILSRWAFLAGLLVALSFLTRIVGLALLALAAYPLVESWLAARAGSQRHPPATPSRVPKGKSALLVAFLLPPILAWAYWGYAMPRATINPLLGPGAHVTAKVAERGPLEALTRLWENMTFYATSGVPEALFPGYSWPFQLAGLPLHAAAGLGLLVSGLTAYGFLHSLAGRRTVVEYYLLPYLALMQYQGLSRFLVPILPFLFYYFILGLRQGVTLAGLDRTGPTRRFAAVLYSIVAILAITALATDGYLVMRTHQKGVYAPLGSQAQNRAWEGYYEASRWLRDQGLPGDIVMASAPWQTYLMSGHKVVPYPSTQDGRLALEAAATVQADYLLIDTFYWWYPARTASLRGAIQSAGLPRLFSQQGTEIYLARRLWAGP